MLKCTGRPEETKDKKDISMNKALLNARARHVKEIWNKLKVVAGNMKTRGFPLTMLS